MLMRFLLLRITLSFFLLVLLIPNQSKAANEIKRDGRFMAYDDGTVLDTRTNLMWAAKDNGSNITWQDAKHYCENYRGGGYTNWRMPTQDELAGLHDPSSKGYAIHCESQYPRVKLTDLIHLTCCCPWALETLDADAAGFNFYYGVQGWFLRTYSEVLRALPVRSVKVTSLSSISPATSSLAKNMIILVHPFENTGNKEYAWISAGMTDTVITDLTRIKNVSVVSNADRKKILEEAKLVLSGLTAEDKIIKLGKLSGANVIFTGSYLVSGNRIRVHARLVNVETGKIESTTRIDGTLDGIFDLQDKVVFTLMGETEKVQIADIKPVTVTDEDKKAIKEKPKPKVNAYELYSKGLELQGSDPNGALAKFRKALDIDPDYADALRNAGFTAGTTLNLFSEAFGYLERAERLLKNRNEINTANYADLIMTIGDVYLRKGQLDGSMEYYLNAKSTYHDLSLQDTSRYATILMNIGLVFQRQGRLDNALEYQLNAKSIYNSLSLQNTVDYANLLLNIGTVYQEKGQLDSSMEYYLSAKSTYSSLSLQKTSGYASIMIDIGNVYLNKGRLDDALEYYLNAKSIYNNLNLQSTDHYANLMTNMGILYQNKGRLNDALEYYLNAKSIYDRLHLQSTVAYAIIINNLASLYEQQGQRDKAGKHYRMAYDGYVKANYSGPWKDNALKNAERLGY